MKFEIVVLVIILMCASAWGGYWYAEKQFKSITEEDIMNNIESIAFSSGHSLPSMLRDDRTTIGQARNFYISYGQVARSMLRQYALMICYEKNDAQPLYLQRGIDFTNFSDPQYLELLNLTGVNST